MTINDLIVATLEQNLWMVKATLEDFSDADMMFRAAPTANHPTWQLGHLCRAEHNLVSMVKPGGMPELPAGFADKFDKKTATLNDPKAFATKQELLELFARQRQGTIAIAKAISQSDLDKATPENVQRFAKTGAEMLNAQSGHTTMHIGQFQVIRRMLGKPVLF